MNSQSNVEGMFRLFFMILIMVVLPFYYVLKDIFKIYQNKKDYNISIGFCLKKIVIYFFWVLGWYTLVALLFHFFM